MVLVPLRPPVCLPSPQKVNLRAAFEVTGFAGTCQLHCEVSDSDLLPIVVGDECRGGLSLDLEPPHQVVETVEGVVVEHCVGFSEEFDCYFDSSFSAVEYEPRATFEADCCGDFVSVLLAADAARRDHALFKQFSRVFDGGKGRSWQLHVYIEHGAVTPDLSLAEDATFLDFGAVEREVEEDIGVFELSSQPGGDALLL